MAADLAMLLVKKTNSQELGYRQGKPSRAGEYLFVSKTWARYFPILSRTVRNDCAPVRIETPENRSAILPFVYHNDKWLGKGSRGRDEFRLYVASALSNKLLQIKPGDLVVFDVSNPTVPSDHFRVRVVPSGTQLAKDLECERKRNETYWSIDAAKMQAADFRSPSIGLLSSEGHGEAALCEPELFAETVVDEKQLSGFLEDTPDDVLARRIPDSMFRELVVAAYSRRCAVSDATIWAGNFTSLEAAHVMPASHGGKNLPCNGIALSRDLHWAFDRGAFTFDDDKAVLVHPKVRCQDLKTLGGRSLRRVEDSFYSPRQEFIEYHRQHVYSGFLRTGALPRAV